MADEEDPKKPGGDGSSDGEEVRFKGWALKTVGTVVGAVGTATGMAVIGSAVLFLRFSEANLPAIQGISVQPNPDVVAQGAKTTIVFVLVAVAAVALLYLCDSFDIWLAKESEKKDDQNGTPSKKSIRAVTAEGNAPKAPADGHRIGLASVAALCAVGAAAIVWILTTGLSFEYKAVLIALAALFTGACAGLGWITLKNFWSLAGAVFVVAIAFSAISESLIVVDQKFVQSVAVLRGPEDDGLTGVYVAANRDNLYFSPEWANGEARPMEKLALEKGVSYAVGPLESATAARATAEAMLKTLEEEQYEPPEKGAGKEEEGGEQSGEGGKSGEGENCGCKSGG